MFEMTRDRQAIVYSLSEATEQSPIEGGELRRRLEFAGYTFINAAVFYGELATLKKARQIAGGMVNGKRCYWKA